MGVVPLLLAVMLGSEGGMLPRAVLVGSFLVLTSPIVAHEIGRAAHSVQERSDSTPLEDSVVDGRRPLTGLDAF